MTGVCVCDKRNCEVQASEMMVAQGRGEGEGRVDTRECIRD